VWVDEANRQPGFVADPAKGGVPGRRANDPHWIYPGEKVALPNNTLRRQGYRENFRGFLGQKEFSREQADTMTGFIAARLAAGRG
jgi:hypothetical protein